MQNGSYGGPREDTLPNAVIQEDTNWTALHEAASIGDDKKVQTILSTNADFTAKEAKHGNTPLHEAAWRGFSRCVKALCAPPNNVKKTTKDKKLKGCISETRGALHSALLGIKNNGGFSALHLAAQNGHNQSCREILLAGADPDVQNNYGDTPLHTACRYGHAGATRILISASCDPNKNNLNGDTPLHIAAAMGRRKLTRILLEAAANTEIKNGQNETPRDIAARKHFTEIIEILNQSKSKSTKSKTERRPTVDDVKNSRRKKSKTADRTDCAANPINWSPYGCHYFPDPRTFPSPKLETLPKEPLKNGEQYFLDLGGNIRKGPVGVGNTCYCGPFFKHIEEKISRNRKSIRKYVHKATERIDSKVQALALKTDDQIEQLTRSMLADRIRCEGRRMHLEHWLKRGEAYRLTTGTQSKSKKNFDNVNTLTRCKSLDILDDDSVFSNRLSNARSFDILQGVNVTVHRNPEPSDDDDDSLISVASFGQRTSKNSENSRNTQNEGQWDGIGMEADYYSVSERLEELLAKTNEILEMEKEASRRRKDELLAFSDDSVKKRDLSTQKQSRNHRGFFTTEILEQLRRTSLNDHNQIYGENQSSSKEHQSDLSLSPLSNGIQTQSPELSGNNYGISEKELDRKSDMEHERSSVLSDNSQHHHNFMETEFNSDFSHNHQRPTSSGTSQLSNNSTNASVHSHNLLENSNTSMQYENIAQMHENKQALQNVISALRKDHNIVREIIQAELLKENEIEEENASYTDDQTVLNGFFENTCFEETAESSNNTLKSEKASITVSAGTETDQSNSIKQKKSRISSAKDWLRGSISSSKEIEDGSQRVNGTVKNVEIKNSEIKSLKKTSTGILKRSKVQELVARIQGKLMSSSKATEESSESSEDEQNEQNENLTTPQQNDLIQGASNYYYNRAQPQIPSTSIVLGGNSNQCTLNNYLPNQFIPSYENNTPLRHLNTQHLIPKDAYFHELPNKNRSLSKNQELTINSNNFYLPQPNLQPHQPQHPQQHQQQYQQQYQQGQIPLQIPSQQCQIQFQRPSQPHSPVSFPPNTNELSARTRNPLLYPQGLEPPLNKNYVNSPYFHALNELEHSSNPDSKTVWKKSSNQNEKLLTNRKFAYASGIDLKFPTALQKKCNQMYQQFTPSLVPSTSVSISPVDQQPIERDMSNDSGFSTKIYEGSHRPSPTLSGTAVADYGGLQISQPLCSQSTNEDDVPYFIGNSSSLV